MCDDALGQSIDKVTLAGALQSLMCIGDFSHRFRDESGGRKPACGLLAAQLQQFAMSLVHVSLREAYRQLEFIVFAMSLADVSLRVTYRQLIFKIGRASCRERV